MNISIQGLRMTVDTRFGTYPEKFAKYVRPTDLVDFDVAAVKKQAHELTKEATTAREALTAIHSFVSSLPLGFDREDSPASVILRNHRAQCNTKTTLFIAMARTIGIPARLHAWSIKRKAHKVSLPKLVYLFTPRVTLFTLPEVYHGREWCTLDAVLSEDGESDPHDCPFDDAPHRDRPIPKELIVEDLGSFWHPDTFWATFGTNADGWRKLALPFVRPRKRS